MSFLSFGDKRKGQVSLLIDIGNGSLTGSFVLFSKNAKPKFLYTIKRSFGVGDKPDASRLADNMLSILDSLLQTMAKDGFTDPYWKNKTKTITPIVVSFSSPWFVLKTKEIHITKDVPYVVTKAFLDSILSTEEVLFKTQILKDVPLSSADPFVIIEKNIAHAKINGHVVSDIIGKKTKDFEAHISLSAIAKSIEEKVVNIISKNTHIPRENIFMYSFPVVLFSVVRDNFAKESDFLLLDITGEISDITLVRGEIITKTASLPFGRNFVIRQVAKALNVSPEIALSSISMYIQNKTHTAASDMLEEVLSNIEKEWAIYLEDTLVSLDPDIAFPKTVYVTANSDTAPLFIEFLKMPKTDRTSDFRKNVNIVHVSSNSLSNFCESNSKIVQDEFVSLLAIFYNRLIQNQ